MSRQVLPPILLAAFVAASVPLGTARAQEAATEIEGRAHFRRGVEFFKEGDFRTALIEFKRAYELAPNYKVLYNLGQASLELQDYASALRSFERYLLDGGKDVATARRAQVEGDIEKLRRRVARIEVTVNVSDAEIFVDDVAVGRAPLAGPLVISAGRRKLSATKGGINAVRVIDVVGGDTATVSLELVEPKGLDAFGLSDATPAPNRASTRSAQLGSSTSAGPEGSSGRAGVWVGVSATAALAAGAVAVGVLTLGAKRDFDDTLGRYGADPQAVADARSKVRTFALATDVLAGAAIVAGGITLVAALSGGSSREPVRSVRLDLSPSGLVASGRF